MKNKRGLNYIISSVLLVLLGIVAVGVFWGAFRNSIESSSENAQTGIEGFIDSLFGREIDRVEKINDNEVSNADVGQGSEVEEISRTSSVTGCDPPLSGLASVSGSNINTIINIGRSDLESTQKWNNFENDYGKNWIVRWDLNSETPTRISGRGISSTEFGIQAIDENNLDILARDFLDSNFELLRVDVSNLNLVKKHKDNSIGVVTYQQEYYNIPIWNRYVTIAEKNNNIVLYKSSYCEFVSASTNPELSESNAENKAKQFFNAKNINILNSELVIYPLDVGKDVLAYKIDLPQIKNPSFEKDNPFIQPTIFIDAVSGYVIDWFDNIKYETLSGSVSGMIYPKFTDVPQIEKPFSHEWIYANGLQGITNELGYYEIGNLNGNVNLNAFLEGPWANVFNVRQERTFHSANLVAPTTHSWNWEDIDNSYKQEESNAFYHTSIIHDYITKPSLNVSEMNFQMTVNVNLPDTCNAYYTYLIDPETHERINDSINFYTNSSEQNCESAALDAGVIYHEYGHGINQHLVGTNFDWPFNCEPGNMDEGIADYWGCTIMNDSCDARFLGGVCMRPCENINKYPGDYTCQRHSGAQIISGSFWDLREIYGAGYVDKLVVDALRLQPMSFSELLENVLITDDDNEDLSDGTPHIDDICHSFWDNHGIFNRFCAGHTLSGVAVLSNPNPQKKEITYNDIEIRGSVYGNINQPLNNYLLEYSTAEDPSNWHSEYITISDRTKSVVEGVLGYLNISNIQGGLYKLRIVVNYGGNLIYSYPSEFIIDRDMKQGWSVDIGDRIHTPLLGDVNRDTRKEVLVHVGSYVPNLLRVYESDGNYLKGWEEINWIFESFSKPALGDIEGDGFNEIISTTMDGTIRVYKENGEVLWDYFIGDYEHICGAPTLSDLNKDDKLEIIIGSYNSNLYVFDNSGNILWNRATIGNVGSTSSVGDLNNNGDLEIVVNSYNRQTKEFKIYIYNNNGEYFIDPVSVDLNEPNYGSSYCRESSPVLADLNDDGNLEIISGLPDGSIGVWNHFGDLLWNYSITNGQYVYSPSVGDVDGDGDLEIAVSAYYNGVYVFNHDGTLLQGWPVYTPIYVSGSSPTLSDLDNDGRLEVIVGTSKKVYIFNYLGEEVLENKFFIIGGGLITPAITDLENNGFPDVVYSSEYSSQSNHKLVVWELGTQLGTTNKGWPELHYDNRNTGCYDCLPKENACLSTTTNARTKEFVSGQWRNVSYSFGNTPWGFQLLDVYQDKSVYLKLFNSDGLISSYHNIPLNGEVTREEVTLTNLNATWNSVLEQRTAQIKFVVSSCEEQEVLCENGVVDLGEVCDSDYIFGDCDSNAWSYWGYQECKDDCSGYGSCVVTHSCGDGVLQEQYEQCDDGNRDNNDGCSSSCDVEKCGDLICQANENCGTCSSDCGEAQCFWIICSKCPRKPNATVN